MCSCAPLLKAIDAYLQKIDGDLVDALTDAGFIDARSTVQDIEDLEELIVHVLLTQESTITREVLAAADLQAFARDVWPRLQASDDLAADLQEIFMTTFSQQIPRLTSGYTAQIDPELVVSAITRRTTSWVESWSEELGQIMQLNTHTEIDELLTTTLQEGKGVAEFTRGLQDSGIRENYHRARQTAVTEMLRAHSYARDEAFIQCPAVDSKMWVHSGGYRIEPRTNHVELNGVVIPYNETFELEGADGEIYYPRFPRDVILPPGESISCHCNHIGIVNQDILGLSLEERQRLQYLAIEEDDGLWELELDALNRAKAGIEPV